MSLEQGILKINHVVLFRIKIVFEELYFKLPLILRTPCSKCVTLHEALGTHTHTHTYISGI
jgi:hypothetical protein